MVLFHASQSVSKKTVLSMNPCTNTYFRDFRVRNRGGKGHVHRKMQTLAMSAAQLSSCAGHFYGLRKETLIL